MFDDAFLKLGEEEAARILDEVNPQIDGRDYDPLETTVLAVDLPFYEEYQFLDIQDHTSTPAQRNFSFYKPGDARVIDFTNDPIYQLNADAPILLNTDNLATYVKFFFTYVSGRHGRFLVVENVDDINWKEDPPPNARAAIAKMITPLVLKEEKDDGSYILSCNLVFKTGLFKSDVIVKPNGLVALQNEELVIEDMPILDDVIGQ